MSKLEIIITIATLALIILFTAYKSELDKKLSFANSQNENRLFHNNSEKELLRFESAIVTTIF